MVCFFIRFIVRIILFEKSPSFQFLALFHGLGIVTSEFMVRLNMARHTQQFDIVHIVCQPLHRIRVVRVCRLYWYLMVAIYTGGYESLALAPLT